MPRNRDVILHPRAPLPTLGDVPVWTGDGWEPRGPSRQLQPWQTSRLSIPKPGAGTALGILGWQFDGTFSVTDADTVEWTAGTLTFGSGEEFSISAGNTGDMAARTYIYFRREASETALQSSTTASDAVGYNTILIAVADTGTTEAWYYVFGGTGGLNITGVNIEDGSIVAANIAANTITANEIAANTITANEIAANTITAGEIDSGAIDTDELAAGAVTAAKITVTDLAAINADLGNITAGQIVVGDASNKLWLNDSDDGALNIGGLTKGSAPFRVTAAGALTATSATVSGTITSSDLTATGGTLGGWTIESDRLYQGTKIGLTAKTADDHPRIWIQNSTFGAAGIQLNYNAGSPRLYVGDGSNKYLKFDGTNLSVSGGVITSPQSGTALELLGWTFTGTFSSTDADTATWTAGTLRFGSGQEFSIGAGNTGNMTARTYIYFDKAISETALQTTTTQSNAVGANKTLIAVAENNSDSGATECWFFVMGGSGDKLIHASQLVANSITANELAANSVTATEIDVGYLSAVSADMGTLTAGAINMFTGTWDTDATGFRLTADEICGQNAGADQVLLAASTGKLTAGGGAVTLDANNVKITTSSDVFGTTQNTILWEDGSNNVLAQISGGTSGGGSYGAFRATSQAADGVASTKLIAQETGGACTAIVESRTASDANSYILLDLDTTVYTRLTLSEGEVVLDSGTGAVCDVRVEGGLQVGDTGSDLVSAGNILYTGKLQSRPASTTYDTYAFHPLTTPATSTSWDGDAKTTGDSGTIDLSTEFGIPAGVKAVALRLSVRDETTGVLSYAGPGSGDAALLVRTQVADLHIDNCGVVPCDSNGDIYWNTNSELDNVVLVIWGYWI